MTYLNSLGQEFWEKGRVDDCPIYDMHAHMGAWNGIFFPFAQPDRMIRRMDRCNTVLAVFSHHSSLSNITAGNKPAIAAVSSYPDRFLAYCVINPNYPVIISKELSSFERNKDAFFGLKFHAAMHEVPMTDERYKKAFEYSDDNALPVLMHTWKSNSFCGEEVVEVLAKRYKKAVLIMGHSCKNNWDAAAKLAAKYENVYLELCAVLDERNDTLKKFVNKAGSHKILFGTDFPWFDYHYYIGGVIGADISEVDMRNIFYKNAKRLLRSKERDA